MNAAWHQEPYAPRKKASALGAWLCLFIAWICFVVPVPGIGVFVGWPLNLVAFILAIVIMVRGYTLKGLIPLVSSLVISPIIYLIGLAVLGWAAVGGSSYADYKARAEQMAAGAASAAQTRVSARQLYAAYQENEISADATYKGKRVEISGVVASIESDLSDMPLVMLEGGDVTETDTVNLSGLSKAQAASLTKGQNAVFQCTVQGEVLGVPLLEACTVK